MKQPLKEMLMKIGGEHLLNENYKRTNKRNFKRRITIT